MALTPEQQALMLRAEMDKQGITDPQLRAGIAAIAGGESGFSMKPEMGYAGTSDDRIRLIFGSRVNSFSDDQLDQLKVNPEAFFNVVYGGPFGARQLGNIAPSGDGFKFRGRGLFQLTGRANYTRYGQMIGRDLLTDPEVADDPEVACAIAVAYMRDRYKGNGWEGMKSAVGFNIDDIASTKDALFAEYSASGEFGPLPAGLISVVNAKPTDAPVAVASVAPAAVVRPAIDRVKAIQTILAEGGLYTDAIDGVFGNLSETALNALIDQVG